MSYFSQLQKKTLSNTVHLKLIFRLFFLKSFLTIFLFMQVFAVVIYVTYWHTTAIENEHL